MAMYVGGTGDRISVLSIDFDSDTSEVGYTVHAIDEEKYQVVTRSKALPVVSREADAIVVFWNDGEHRVIRTNKGRIDEKGRERDFARVQGFGCDERGLGFGRYYEDELRSTLELLEYNAHVSGRVENGLPLGPHLEPQFQRRYYCIDETIFVLSLILKSLSNDDLERWEKYRIELTGAVYASRDDVDLHECPEEADYLAVAIVARDGDDVVFYNNGRAEDFRYGVLTTDTDASGDRIIQDRKPDESEVSALQRALDKEWNPQRY